MIESSEDMREQGKMDAVNNAMHELLLYIREMAKHVELIQIRYSVLKFADNAHWLNIGTEELILPASNGFEFLTEEICRIITRPIMS